MGQHEMANHCGQLDTAGQRIGPVICDLGNLHALHEAPHVDHLGGVFSRPLRVEETRGWVLRLYSVSVRIEHRAVADTRSWKAGDHAVV